MPIEHIPRAGEHGIEERHGFLTRRQRELLTGDVPASVSASSKRTHKSEMKKNARAAIGDWALLAESNQFDDDELSEIVRLSGGAVEGLEDVPDLLPSGVPSDIAGDALSGAAAQAQVVGGDGFDTPTHIRQLIPIIKNLLAADLEDWDDILDFFGAEVARLLGEQNADKEAAIAKLRRSWPTFINSVEENWPDETE